MEASDVFEQGIEVGDADPFAGTDFEGADIAGAPDVPPSNGDEALPVVDREGQPVEATPEEEAAKARAESATPPAAPQATETPQEGAEAPQEAAARPAVAEDAPPAPTATPAPPQDAPPAPEATGTEAAQPTASEPEAQVPAEQRGKGGRVTHRRYVILRVLGPGKFEQIEWHEDKDGKMARKGAAGAKRQNVALARGAEDALKIGYAALGSPQEGATLIAVAAAYFQPKQVKPVPPEPTRQRLQIG